MAFRIRFQVSIVTAILLIIAAMTASTLTSVYVASTRTARETAVRLFEQVSQGAVARIDRQVGQTLALANLRRATWLAWSPAGPRPRAPASPWRGPCAHRHGWAEHSVRASQDRTRAPALPTACGRAGRQRRHV